MAGYTRTDTTNNIANGNTVDATYLDQEYDGIQAAFNATTGHSHGGAVGEGAPITTLGPAQDVVITASLLRPKTDNTVSLGTSTLEYKDLWIDGVANIDSLVADTADINGGTIDGTVIGSTIPRAVTGTVITGTSFVGPLTGAVTGNVTGNTAGVHTGNVTGDVTGNLTGNVTGNVAGTVTGNAGSATVLANARTINGTSFNGSANIVTTNWGTSRTITLGSTGKAVDGSANVTWTLTEMGVGTLGTQASSAVTITGGSITGITDLAIVDGGTGASTAAGALTNLGLIATAAEINTLSGILPTVTELNFVDGVTSSIQTQLNTKAPLAAPTFTGVPAAPTAAPGTNTTQLATTAFVQAGLTAYSPIVLLGTITTTSGASQSLTSLVLTPYKFLRFVVNGVSFNGNANLLIGGARCSDESGSSAGAITGIFDVALVSGNFMAAVGPVGANTQNWGGNTGYSTATTTVTFAASSGTFDSGNIVVYGLI